MINYISNGKATIIRWIWKILVHKIVTFENHIPTAKNKIKFEFKQDLANYTTKSDFKDETVGNTSRLAKGVDLAAWKSNVDRPIIGKLGINPVVLSNFSEVIKSEVLKNTVFHEFVSKWMLFRLLVPLV